MNCAIQKYQVQHPLLRKYIKFFWEIHIEHIHLNHKLIPVRNIDLKFNLNDTSHYLYINGQEQLLEDVYFSGLQDHFRNAYMKIDGKIDILGICFLPEGFFPFLKIPISELTNKILGANEVGFKPANTISKKLKEANDVADRLNIIESELLSLLDNENKRHEDFREIFNTLNQKHDPLRVTEFCKDNNIGLRRLERMYNKYIGLSAKTYNSLHRFQNGLNQLLYSDYAKLSDIAYGNEYFDQMHFIREFKRFAGNAPKNFLHQNNSILQIGKFA